MNKTERKVLWLVIVVLFVTILVMQVVHHKLIEYNLYLTEINEGNIQWLEERIDQIDRAIAVQEHLDLTLGDAQKIADILRSRPTLEIKFGGTVDSEPLEFDFSSGERNPVYNDGNDRPVHYEVQ